VLIDLFDRHFIESHVWATYKDAANGTLLDSDDVLLLRPVRADAAFLLAADRDDRSPCQVVASGVSSLGASVLG
jgi:hypothetical protein